MIRKFSLTDIIVVLFLLLSGIIVIYGKDKTEHFILLVTARIIALGIISLFLLFQNKRNNTIFKFFRDFYPLIFTAYFYGETGYYNNIFTSDLDSIFVGWDEIIFGFQPSLIFSANYNNIWLSEIMYFSYFSFYLLIIFYPVLLYINKDPRFKQFFFVLIFSFYSYYLFFGLFPVVGPQFYFSAEELGKIELGIFGKTVSFIQEMGETPTGAFPSSHVGASFIILISSIQHKSKFIIIIAFTLILICFSTVYIKAHYFVDVIAGIISGFILYILGNKIYSHYQTKLLYRRF